VQPLGNQNFGSNSLISAPNSGPGENPFRQWINSSDKGCVPLAYREVLRRVTGIDPGNLETEMARANGDPNHDWNSAGMTPTEANHRPLAEAHGAKFVMLQGKTTSDLISQVGEAPVSVSIYYKDSYSNGHQVTVRQDSGSGNYIMTNAGYLGEELTLTRSQVTGVFSFPSRRFDFSQNTEVDYMQQAYLTKDGQGVYTGFSASK
jgi:hypothetical protein